MSFRQITARVTVEQKDASAVEEAILKLIDSFAVKRIPVFDSEVTSQRLHHVRNAKEVQVETQLDGQ